MNTLAILIALSFVLPVCFLIYRVEFREKINARMFYLQIKKLIRANNIERAIKLCNVEPNAIMPRLFKVALCRANRNVDEVHLEAQKGILWTQTKDLSQRYGYGAFALFSLTFVLAEAAIVLPNGLHPWPLIAVVIVALLGLNNLRRSKQVVANAQKYFARVLMILAARRRIVLVQSPREELTDEQIETWRKAMDEFTEYVKELRTRGPNFNSKALPAKKIYAKVADPKTGMLAPGFDRPY
jgi:hypothetical protein